MTAKVPVKENLFGNNFTEKVQLQEHAVKVNKDINVRTTTFKKP